MSEHVSTAEPPTKIEASGPEAPPGGINIRRDAVFFLIAASVFALDQITKVIVRASLDRGEVWPDRDWIVNIVNVSNSGAAFGILQGQTFFLIGTSIVGVAAIFLYYMFPPLEHGLLRAGLALQLGGAAGNMTDRIRSGRVTDWINFDFWPAFNVADASISIGVATIIVFFLLIETDRFRGPPEESSE
jgi:signal peptidase II